MGDPCLENGTNPVQALRAEITARACRNHGPIRIESSDSQRRHVSSKSRNKGMANSRPDRRCLSRAQPNIQVADDTAHCRDSDPEKLRRVSHIKTLLRTRYVNHFIDRLSTISTDVR